MRGPNNETKIYPLAPFAWGARRGTRYAEAGNLQTFDNAYARGDAEKKKKMKKENHKKARSVTRNSRSEKRRVDCDGESSFYQADGKRKENRR